MYDNTKGPQVRDSLLCNSEYEGLTRGVATAKFLMLGEICPTGKL